MMSNEKTKAPSGVDQHLLFKLNRPASYLALDDINRPVEAIQRIHDALAPLSLPYEVKGNRRVSSVINERNVIWLITTGTVTFYRSYDDLKIITSAGPIMTGMAELFQPIGRHYFHMSRGSKVSYVYLDEAHKILDEKSLWKDVAELLTYIHHMMIYRDEHLVSKNSYTIIRAKLIEYMNKKDVEYHDRAGVAAYIQNTTHLSRSLIYHILSSLTQGGYIKIQNGKLTEVVKLPEEF